MDHGPQQIHLSIIRRSAQLWLGRHTCRPGINLGLTVPFPLWTACGEIDVVLVLDESGSIGNDNWVNAVVPFAVALASKLPIHPDYTRLGCVRFHTDAEIFFEINQAGLQDNAAVSRGDSDPPNPTGKRACTHMQAYTCTSGNTCIQASEQNSL